jgi:DNA-binding MarR family transcriptional regulator
MDSPKPVRLPCLCASIRRAARVLTALYDEALRPLGLTNAQFTVLQALSLAGEMTQGQLADLLAIDSTTLTRNLRLMTRAGWVERREGSDRREWRFNLTPGGRKIFRKALPGWEKVQQSLHSRLGQSGWADSFAISERVVTAAQTKGGNL